MSRADVIVVGVVAVGSAATLHLAREGKRVLGFDACQPARTNGSSHGDTRITRLAIGEGEHYTPLVIRSHELWREFEREAGVDLLVQCGGLIISNRVEAKESHGVPAFLDNTIGAARKYNIPHETLSAPDIRKRFPQFNVADHEAAYYEPSAGYLRVEACVEAQLKLAQKQGAELNTDTPIKLFRPASGGVEVVTAAGDAYQAEQLLVCAGAWLPGLLKLDPPHHDLFKVTRQVMHWPEAPEPQERFMPPTFPSSSGSRRARAAADLRVSADQPRRRRQDGDRGQGLRRPRPRRARRAAGAHRGGVPGLFRAMLPRPRADPQDQDLLLHRGRRRPLRHRPPSRQRPRAVRLGLLGARLQALGGTR